MHSILKGFIPLLIILIIASPASALTMSVSGSTTGQAVTVTLDEEAEKPVQYIPHLEGVLSINAVNQTSGEFAKEKTITISNNPSPTPTTPPGGDGGDPGGSPSPSWKTVIIEKGTFNITAENSGKIYTVNKNTALGILDGSGYIYTITDKNYAEYGSLFLCTKRWR